MSATRTQRLSSLLRPWLIVTLCCLFYALLVIAISDGDPLALVTIGTRFSERIPEEAGGTEGYDGQFVYYIARNPSTAEHFLDAPAYRFQRILLPALARLLAFGQEPLIPWALLVINLAALGAGTKLLENILVENDVSRWYALGYGFALGTFGAARLSLPEPLAYGLALVGITLARRDQWLLSAVLFALAALAKETALLLAGGAGLYLLYKRRYMQAVLFGLISGAPFMIWQIVLKSKLGEFGVGSGGAGATSFEIIPFAGFLRILTGSEALITYEFTVIPPGDLLAVPTETVFSPGIVVVFVIFLALLMPFVLFPTLWALRECWRAVRLNTLTLAVFLLLASAGIMLFVPFSTYREPLGILRFVVGLHIAVVIYAAEKRSQRALLNSTIWGYTVLLIIASDLLSPA